MASQKTPPERSPLRAPARWMVRNWHRAALGAIVAVILVGVILRSTEPIESLRYGQFKRKLERGEIRSALIGTAEVTGELEATWPDGRHKKFRSSRVGMERDEALALLLAAHVPDGNYDADSAPSTA